MHAEAPTNRPEEGRSERKAPQQRATVEGHHPKELVRAKGLEKAWRGERKGDKATTKTGGANVSHVRATVLVVVSTAAPAVLVS